MIGVYILLGASGSVLSLGTSLVSRDLVDAITGVNSLEIIQVVAAYVGVGVAQIFINAVKSRLSLKVRLKVTNEIRGDIYEQVLRTSWESLAKYRSGDLLYRVNGDAGTVANTILTFLPNVVTALISFGGRFHYHDAERSLDGADCADGGSDLLSHIPPFCEEDAGLPRGITWMWPAAAPCSIRRPFRIFNLSKLLGCWIGLWTSFTGFSGNP